VITDDVNSPCEERMAIVIDGTVDTTVSLMPGPDGGYCIPAETVSGLLPYFEGKELDVLLSLTYEDLQLLDSYGLDYDSALPVTISFNEYSMGYTEWYGYRALHVSSLVLQTEQPAEDTPEANIMLPNLVGRRYESAIATYNDIFVFVLTCEYLSPEKCKQLELQGISTQRGIIFEQDIDPDTLVRPDTEIQIKVSQGPSKVELPDYNGKNIANYAKELIDLDVKFAIYNEPTNAYPMGQVVYCSKSPNELVDVENAETVKIYVAEPIQSNENNIYFDTDGYLRWEAHPDAYDYLVETTDGINVATDRCYENNSINYYYYMQQAGLGAGWYTLYIYGIDDQSDRFYIGEIEYYFDG